jgi:tRNA(Arg) A34 adenosine deaminase TadA
LKTGFASARRRKAVPDGIEPASAAIASCHLARRRRLDVQAAREALNVAAMTDAPPFDDADRRWMDHALALARRAAAAGETPVGAVIVDPATDTLVAEAHNAPIALDDPSGHAELLAIRRAGLALGNYRLAPGLTLYVTLEPCTMCAGAISHARLSRLVFGAEDVKGGAVINGVRFFEQPTCHWRPSVAHGLGGQEAASLLRDFFRARRLHFSKSLPPSTA